VPTVNVLFLTQGPETSPSPRYRVYQLLPGLQHVFDSVA